MGLNGPYGKGEKGLKRWPHPSPWSGPNWTREGGRTLPSFSFPLPFSYSHKERRSPTPGGSRTPPLARPPPWPAASPLLLYIRGQGGTPSTHLIYDILAVCGAPSTILHLDNTVAELRRSPASVEHHHRHHAVVLTKLSLNTRLDRSSRDVIELNVCRTRRCHAFGT